MREYYNTLGIDPFSILPETYLVNSTHDAEFRLFEAKYRKYLEIVKKARDERQVIINEYLQRKK